MSFNAARLLECALENIAGIKNLHSLRLARTLVTDEGLRHLAAIGDLTFLDLSYTKVTDAGLSYLAKLTRLQTLELFGTTVTDDGMDALQRKLPKCNIKPWPRATTQSDKTLGRS